MGVDVLDLLPPPPEFSPTVGGGTNFWLNWGYRKELRMGFFKYALVIIAVILIILLCVLFYNVIRFVRKEARRGDEKE